MPRTYFDKASQSFIELPDPMPSHAAPPRDRRPYQVDPATLDQSTWGQRGDGSAKGNGWMGVWQRPDGAVSSEISIGVEINGREVEIPVMVPTLTPQERDWLLTNPVDDPSRIPMSIQQKAVDFAKQRMRAGQPVFAGAGDSPAVPANALIGPPQRSGK